LADLLSKKDFDAIEERLCSIWVDPDTSLASPGSWKACRVQVQADLELYEATPVEDTEPLPAFVKSLLSSCSQLDAERLSPHTIELLEASNFDGALKYLERTWASKQNPTRYFNEAWLNEFKYVYVSLYVFVSYFLMSFLCRWLRYDEERKLMYCMYCRCLGKSRLGAGSHNFRRSTLVEHCKPGTFCCSFELEAKSRMQSQNIRDGISEATDLAQEQTHAQVQQTFLVLYNTLLKEGAMSDYVADMQLAHVIRAPDVSPACCPVYPVSPTCPVLTWLSCVVLC